MYRKRLWKSIMAGTLALTMLLTPLGTGSVVSAAEMETAGTETLIAPVTEGEDWTSEAEEITTTAEADEAELEDRTEEAETSEVIQADTANGDVLLDEAHFPDATF